MTIPRNRVFSEKDANKAKLCFSSSCFSSWLQMSASEPGDLEEMAGDHDDHGNGNGNGAVHTLNLSFFSHENNFSYKFYSYKFYDNSV